MREVVFQPLALQDIENIYNYTLQIWGQSQAESYVRDLQSGIMAIRAHSSLGRILQYDVPSLRIYRVRDHLLIYRNLDEDTLLIIRILHARMDVPRHL